MQRAVLSWHHVSALVAFIVDGDPSQSGVSRPVAPLREHDVQSSRVAVRIVVGLRSPVCLR